MKYKLLVLFLIALFRMPVTYAEQSDADKIVAALADKLRAANVESGLIVTSIAKGGAGDRAGLVLGDVIVKVNDDPVIDAGSFATLRDKYVGTLATFTFWREGHYITSTPIVLPAAVNISGS